MIQIVSCHNSARRRDYRARPEVTNLVKTNKQKQCEMNPMMLDFNDQATKKKMPGLLNLFVISHKWTVEMAKPGL